MVLGSWFLLHSYIRSTYLLKLLVIALLTIGVIQDNDFLYISEADASSIYHETGEAINKISTFETMLRSELTTAFQPYKGSSKSGKTRQKMSMPPSSSTASPSDFKVFVKRIVCIRKLEENETSLKMNMSTSMDG